MCVLCCWDFINWLTTVTTRPWMSQPWPGGGLTLGVCWWRWWLKKINSVIYSDFIFCKSGVLDITMRVFLHPPPQKKSVFCTSVLILIPFFASMLYFCLFYVLCLFFSCSLYPHFIYSLSSSPLCILGFFLVSIISYLFLFHILMLCINIDSSNILFSPYSFIYIFCCCWNLVAALPSTGAGLFLSSSTSLPPSGRLGVLHPVIINPNWKVHQILLTTQKHI